MLATRIMRTKPSREILSHHFIFTTSEHPQGWKTLTVGDDVKNVGSWAYSRCFASWCVKHERRAIDAKGARQTSRIWQSIVNEARRKDNKYPINGKFIFHITRPLSSNIDKEVKNQECYSSWYWRRLYTWSNNMIASDNLLSGAVETFVSTYLDSERNSLARMSTKDVASCDKLGWAARGHWTQDLRIRQRAPQGACRKARIRRELKHLSTGRKRKQLWFPH